MSIDEFESGPEYLLPVVSTSVGHSISVESDEIGASTFMKEAKERLLFNNPNLYAMIGHFLEQYGVNYNGAEDVARNAVILAHEILLRQSEADAIRAAIAPDDLN